MSPTPVPETVGYLPPPFEITVSRSPESAVLHLHGELDLATAESVVQGVLAALAGAVSAVALDLAALEFIDATGVRALLTARAHCAGAQVTCEVLPGTAHVERVLRLCRVNRTLGRADAGAPSHRGLEPADTGPPHG